eukprot:CAMPEP_0194219352 /NCGR_PEP_ID=MMETSP0156-20130528/25758_1 /TAXON_ID=33649 /ORGANISM="Thalassionema nitzschioides, Strain L26-B" /LENGTH=1274 /DNA_ID=CAMNT_0038948977 /DNA_START=58 /DNA_END=3882 /DNA_ORIENTATION=-
MSSSQNADECEGNVDLFNQQMPYSNDYLRQYLEQDDDSRCFMSEPSISTEGERTGGSNTPRHLLSPYETLSEEEIETLAQRNRPQSPPLSNVQQLHQPQHQTLFSSPGNTSLSSRGLSSHGNSPHIQPKVELDFMIYEKRTQLKIESTPYGPVLTARPNNSKSELPLPRGSEMPLEAARPENVAPSSRSSSSASSGQQLRVAEFLQNLKLQSIGALEDADSDDFDSDRKPTTADRAEINAVMRRQEQPHQQYGIGTIDTEPDETIVMTLSESDGEKDTDVDFEPLDWEQQHSADDEKTAEKPRRIRYSNTSTRRGLPTKEKGHRRTRSGDDAAAVIMTGSAEWRGMKENDFLVPRLDDENEFESRPWSRTRPTQMQTQIIQPNQSSGDSSGGFVLGINENNSNTRKARRPPRQSRSKSMSSAGEMQHFYQQAVQSSLFPSTTPPNYGENLTNKFRSSSLYQPMSDSSLSIEHSTPEIQNPNGAQSKRDIFFRQQENSLFQIFPSDSSHDSFHRTNQYSRPAEQSEITNTLKLQTGFSESHEETNDTISDSTNGRPIQVKGNSEDLIFSSEETLQESSQCNQSEQRLRFDFRKSTHYSPRSIFAGGQGTSRRKVLRPNHIDGDDEHITNGRKKAFQPFTNAASSQNNQPTFECPKCGLIQRSFFTASSAPSQDNIGGYLALGFFSYVIISLIIFGFEEGWEGLDCFYFAIITLTTAGLGDFVPTTDEGKIICCIFIYFGVACIGLLLGTYIAGMQDENSLKEAMNSRVDNCVRCSTAKTRRESLRSTILSNSSPRQSMPPLQSYYRGSMMPESPSITSKTESDVHHKKRRKYEHIDNVQGTVSTADLQDSFRLDSPLSHSSVSHAEEWPLASRSNSSQKKQSNLLTIDTYGGTRAVPNSPQSPVAAAFQSSIIGSPMTTQILGRQKHTRHSSFDVRSPNVFYQQNNSKVISIRADDGVLPTFHFASDEGLPGFSSMRSVSMLVDSEESDDQSLFSDSENFMNGSKDGRFKTIQYVLLTMKQALMNSIAIISVGSVGFYFIEKMTIVDSFYFTTVLLTTVGYGDLVPETSAGKLFATCYLLIGGTVLLNNMSLISMIPLELRKRRIEKAVLTQFGDQLDDAALRELATGPLIQRLRLSMSRSNGLDECTREMFALAMLVRMGKVNERDVRHTFAAFRRLDVDNEGVLNSKTIITGIMHKKKSMKDLREGIPESPPPSPPLESTKLKTATCSSPKKGGQQQLGEDAPLLDSSTMDNSQFRGGTFAQHSHDEEEAITF